MLNKKYKIFDKKDFQRVYSQGSFRGARALMIKYAKNDLDYSRYTVNISTKITKKATLRNLHRRRIYEFIRINIDQIKPGYDIIFMTKPAILQYDNNTLCKEIIYLLTKAHLYIKKKQ